MKDNGKKTLFILLIILIVINLVLSIKNLIMPKSASLFGIRAIIINNDAMSPEYNKGQVAIAIKKDVSKIEIGDVIAYYEGDKVVTSRVLDKKDTGLRAKEDNNDVYDKQYITNNELIGKIEFSMPIVVMIIIIILLIAFFIWIVIILKNKIFLISDDEKQKKKNA